MQTVNANQIFRCVVLTNTTDVHVR